MRLAILEKLIAKNSDQAADEVQQIRAISGKQVADLRAFVRNMRPPDEGMSLTASLSRLVENFRKDTGISASFIGSDFPDPPDTQVALELLQAVREALNNVQKHSGATRATLTAAMGDRRLEISIEDNGAGYPFSGSFSLDELDQLRLGPVSISEGYARREATCRSIPSPALAAVWRFRFRCDPDLACQPGSSCDDAAGWVCQVCGFQLARAGGPRPGRSFCLAGTTGTGPDQRR